MNNREIKIEYIMYQKRVLVPILIDSNKRLRREVEELKHQRQMKILLNLNTKVVDF